MPAPAAAHAPSLTPYAGLTPPLVLDALDSVGLRGDGRLLQLNSYENRVFQIFLEDGRVVVAKFYRPGRWTDAQILEEHAFAAELEGRRGAARRAVDARAGRAVFACDGDRVHRPDARTLVGA